MTIRQITGDEAMELLKMHREGHSYRDIAVHYALETRHVAAAIEKAEAEEAQADEE